MIIPLQLAMEAAEVLGYPIIERKKRSVARIQQEYGADVIVAGKNRFDLYRIGMDEPFFFHPNSAAFRLKRLMKGETDPLMEVAQLKKDDSFSIVRWDLASDSIIASFITGDSGKVMGIEVDPAVAFITRRGLTVVSVRVGATCTGDESNRRHPCQMRFEFLSHNLIHRGILSTWIRCFMRRLQNRLISLPLRQVGVHSLLTQEWMEQAHTRL